MARYTNIKTKIDKFTQNRYYVNVVYPEIPPTTGDVYIVTKLGDRTPEIKFPNCCSNNLNVYYENNLIKYLEFNIGQHTYKYCCSPTEAIISTSSS